MAGQRPIPTGHVGVLAAAIFKLKDIQKFLSKLQNSSRILTAHCVDETNVTYFFEAVIEQY